MTSSDVTQVQMFFICLRFEGCTGLLECTKDKCQRRANERRATQVTFRALLSSELLWPTAVQEALHMALLYSSRVGIILAEI